jgi:hypothetical protein
MAYQLVTASTDSASGDIVIPLNIGLNVSASQAYPTPQGIVFPDGVYVEVVSGTVVGSVDII